MATANYFEVNSNGTAGDSFPGDGFCLTSGGVCTLHAAIQEANSLSWAFITFASAMTIEDCSLPAITTSGVVINAYDQWNTGSNVPGVILKSTYLCGGSNTILTLSSSDNHIYGIYFQGNGTNDIGLHIGSGSNNTIGHSTTHHRNVFIVNGYAVSNTSSSGNNTIAYNYIGTTNGTSVPSPSIGTRGVHNVSSGNTIANNVIVGQSYSGIYLSGNGNTVDNNIIGLDVNKQNIKANNYGIVLDYSSQNDIINNTIGGNNSYGIYLAVNSDNNDIYNNDISTPWSVSDLGNKSHGIYVTGADNNIIRSNNIHDNDGSGIYVASTSGSTIKGNSISNNQGDGIYLASGVSATVVGGGNSTGLPNKIFLNSGNGISLHGASSVTV
ncbi:MAG: right-handed parallel beta-helix repeat-containing protein, partial [Desulfobulbaceae bacterium]|nr:right-handed parallel beta-helix repeat-containing protein [Desulfobulbaceae bacterium]